MKQRPSKLLIVELKSVEHVKEVHKKQLLTYLKLTGKPLGLLINFNETLLKDGITRMINEPAGFTDPGCLSRVFTLAGLKGSVKNSVPLCPPCRAVATPRVAKPDVRDPKNHISRSFQICSSMDVTKTMDFTKISE